MRTLRRYILAEYLKAVVIALTVFTGFAAAASLYRFSETAAKSGVGSRSMISLAGYLLPYVLLYAMPLALFTAAIIAFGRLSAGNEFVAIKAAGIHPGIAVAPVLAVGLAASLLCVVLADLGLAAGFSAIRNRLLRAAPEVIAGALVPGRSVSFGADGRSRYTMNVLDGPDGSGPRISVAVFKGDRVDRLILAESFDIGVFKREAAGSHGVHVLRFKLRGGHILTGLSAEPRRPGEAPGGLYRPVSFERHTLEVPVAGGVAQGLAIGYRRETMGLSQIISVLRRCREESKRIDLRTSFLRTELAALKDGPGRPEKAKAVKRAIEGELGKKRRNERRAVSLKVEYHRKLSMSFACLAFVLLGIPLGLASKQKSRAMGFALGVGVAFCGYYPLLLLGKTLVEARVVAAWVGMWAPVALITLLGTAWTVRTVRS